MSGLSSSPKLLKGGIVSVDPTTSNVLSVIALQYNPEQLSRSLQVQAGGEGGDRSEALRLAGTPIETISLEAELDATDQLEFPEQYPDTTEYGLHPQLSVLETLIYPGSDKLADNDSLARSGSLEITPMESPLTLFVWSKHRVAPVRITEFSITEEAFDSNLNPIRAKVSLGMRILSVEDLGFSHVGGNLFMSYLQTKEQLKAKNSATLGSLGLDQIG